MCAGVPVILFLDFDGTLVPIRKRPSWVSLPASQRRFLKKLLSMPGVRLAIVSGRVLSDLKKRTGLSGICHVGNHGLQIEGPGIRYLHPSARRGKKTISKIAPLIRAAVRGIPGVWLENKQFSLSLHFRQASAAGKKKAQKLFLERVRPFVAARQVRIMQGKQVLEVRLPVDWNKGNAVGWLIKKWVPARSANPFVVAAGDDRTDEDMFRAIPSGGISVFVGRRGVSTRARYRVDAPGGLYRFLKKLESQLLHSGRQR
jgi:trehalose-phosphatase